MPKYIELPEQENNIIEQNEDNLKVITIKQDKAILTTLKLESEDKIRLNEYLTKLKKIQERKEIHMRNMDGYKGPQMTAIISILIILVLLFLKEFAINTGLGAMESFTIIEKLTIPIVSIGITTDVFMKIITDNSKNVLEETNTKLEYNRDKTSLLIDQIKAKSKTTTQEFTIPEKIKNTEDIYKYVIEQEKNNSIKQKRKIINQIPSLCTPKDLTQNLRIQRIERLKSLKENLLSDKEKTKLPKPNTKLLQLKGRTVNSKNEIK